MSELSEADDLPLGGQWVTFSRVGTTDVIRLAGEIDMANAGVIGREIAAQTVRARAVVIDLTAVSFLDSAGVRLLDTLVGALAERQTPIRLVVAETGAVRMTLRLCAFREDLLDTDLTAAATALG
jgi:anti-sigma B factor antagonist